MDAIEENPLESRREWLINQFGFYAGISPQKQDRQFWKHDNHPFFLYSNKMIQQKVDYIHFNPVEAGFVNEPHKWSLSSANKDSPLNPNFSVEKFALRDF